jgi:hypothetical protein
VLAAILLHRRRTSISCFLRSNRWTFPAMVALVCLPTALLGRMKQGGSPNTLAPTIGFLWIAMLAAYAAAGRRRPGVRRTLTGVALGAALVLAVRLAPRLDGLPELLRAPALPTIAFNVARQAPGTTYFPHRPTIGLLADGRAYHFSSAIEYRNLEGPRLAPHYVRAFLPPAFERMAADWFPYVLHYLPTFRRQVLDARLSAWTVLTADDLVPTESADADYISMKWEPRARPTLESIRLTSPGAPATMRSARISIVSVRHGYAARLDGAIDATVPHETIDVDVLLQDRLDQHLLTLAASVAPDSRGSVSVEWPVFHGIASSADEALAIVRGGRVLEGPSWRLPAEKVHAAVADAGAARSGAATP